MVAALVLQLSEEGRLCLEGSLKEWLPPTPLDLQFHHDPAASRTHERDLHVLGEPEAVGRSHQVPGQRVHVGGRVDVPERSAFLSRGGFSVFEYELPVARIDRHKGYRLDTFG